MSIYAGVAEIVVLALFTIADRRARLIQARCLPVLLGALIVVLPALALFAVTTPARELLQQLMIFPFIEFPKVFDLPYPGYTGRTQDLPFYLPFVLYPLAGFVGLMQASSLAPCGSSSTLAQASFWIGLRH